MKSFFLIACVLIGISIACVPNKSAFSSSPNNNAPINQPSAQPENLTKQNDATCTLKLAAAPVLYGLRLGMTADEVLALFPGSKEDAEVRSSLTRAPSEFGESEFLIRPGKYESKDKFVEIRQITLTLLDGRVSSFTVGYNGPEYKHVDEFVAKFIQGTNLPAIDQWKAYAGMDNTLKILRCVDFETRVFIGGPGGTLNYVLMKDLEADKKLQERYKKAEEKATPTPKR